MKILWISPYAPYDTVGHAGGQNHNYYLKYFKRNTNFDITLLSVCEAKERNKLDLDGYEIDSIVKVYDKTKLLSRLETAYGKINIFRDGGLLNYRKYILLLDAIKEYAARGEEPDVVLTQWTEATLMYETLKKYFPSSKYIAIEEDVAFQGYRRKYENAKGVYRLYKKLKYLYLKKAEVKTLLKYDIVAALNAKDINLLLDEGITKKQALQMCPYYGLYKNAKYAPDIHKLLFYGAMSRVENYTSAIWFIENVLTKLDDEYSFVIVGSNPPKELLKYQSDRVVITGFVDSVEPYFEQCLCLTAPLLLGAGIKIKILEALSAGIPVITNELGAEGINLTSGENYIHCEFAEDYVNAISELARNSEFRSNLSKNGRSHVLAHFDADTSLDALINRISKYETSI